VAPEPEPVDPVERLARQIVREALTAARIEIESRRLPGEAERFR
jgi:hypothetical protein